MQINHSHRSKDKSVAKTKDADSQRTMGDVGIRGVGPKIPGTAQSNLLTRVCTLGQTNSASVRGKSVFKLILQRWGFFQEGRGCCGLMV